MELTAPYNGTRSSAREHWAFALESRPAHPLPVLEVGNDRADDTIPAHLLVIGDASAPLPEQLRRFFSAPQYRVRFVGIGRVELDGVLRDAPDAIILDVGLPERSALEMFQHIRRLNDRIPVIFVTATKGTNTAIEAMQQGAYDYLFKPLDPRELRRVVGEAIEVTRRMRDPDIVPLAGPDRDEGAMIGTCPGVSEVYKAIGRVAGQSVHVLITGESGTGKELVARAIHQHSTRAKAPFLALNCAALPENLLESELFGHEKGAFTGADRRRVGKFEQCHGGTLFLDEIGDMPLAMQAKILRLVQEQTFERLGGNETVSTNVRLIAATHRNLKAWSVEGKFRPDLYYRLGVVNVHLPPLRERGDDLSLLVQHYLRRFSREFGREVRAVAPETMERLRSYSWPGNIRELESVLKQALLRACGPVLLPAFLPEPLACSAELSPAAEKKEAGSDAFTIHQRLGPEARDLYADAHKQLDRLLLPQVIEYARGSQRQSAMMLGIARQTLRQKMLDLGLSVPRPAEAEEDLGG